MITRFIEVEVKAVASIDVTEVGIVSNVKAVQPLKAEAAIDVTELGILTDVKAVQPLKVDVLIEVIKLVRIVTVVNCVQPKKVPAL